MITFPSADKNYEESCNVGFTVYLKGGKKKNGLTLDSMQKFHIEVDFPE